jgi:hypothetical protein
MCISGLLMDSIQFYFRSSAAAVNKCTSARLWALTLVSIKALVFWGVAVCFLIECHQHFWRNLVSSSSW